MNLVPDTVFSFHSDAEKKVFAILQDVSLGENWTAYHSCNLSEHAYKRWAEVDFLLVGPEGAIVLEVKGGGVSVKDGIWTYQGRDGREGTSSEGPIEQAKSARYALEKLLRQKKLAISQFPMFGWGVVFPDTPWEIDTVEMPKKLVANQADCSSAAELQSALRRIINFWKNKEGHPKLTSKEDLLAIKHVIRPDVDVYPAFTLKLGPVMTELLTLTEEQFNVSDIIQENQQAIIYGGAGTGKTFLLMQSARKEAANGKQVLIAAESEILVNHLRKLEASREIQIHNFAELSHSGLKMEPCDILFVDEGQDLATFSAYDVLSSNLKGGMEEGYWRWFMDDNHQAHIRGEYNTDAAELLQTGFGKHRPVRIPLTKNVRNTKEIIQAVNAWTGAVIGDNKLERGDGFPKLFPVCGSTDVNTRLSQRINDFIDDGIPLENIGIVLLGQSDQSIIQGLPPNIRRKCQPLDPLTVVRELRNRILYGDVAAFKGLERPCMIVVGLNLSLDQEQVQNELYVATTRANYDLSIIADNNAINDLQRRSHAKSGE